MLGVVLLKKRLLKVPFSVKELLEFFVLILKDKNFIDKSKIMWYNYIIKKGEIKEEGE